MPFHGTAGFKYTPPGGSLTTVQGEIRLRGGSVARVRTRYRNVALDQRTVDVVTIDGGADEMDVHVRFIDAPADFLTMLEHAADGVTVSYFPDTAGGTSYPLQFMNGDVVLRGDRDRWGFGEYESALRIRRVDGGSLAALL